MKLNRGINLGGFLSQCTHSKEHYVEFVKNDDIKQIAAWGFDHIRLPIDSEVLEDENEYEKKEGYEILLQIISWCKESDLNIILDLHKVYGYDFNDAGNKEKNSLFSNEVLQERFIRLWRKIAEKFWVYDNVAFELLNEVVESDNADSWNLLITKTVDNIRSITERTPIIYGGIQWNSVKTVCLLEKPKQKNIIFTFHFYEPLLFTHQKAYWVENMDKEKDILYPESMEYYKQQSDVLGIQGKTVRESKSKTMGTEFMEELISEAVSVAQEAGVSLYCGEFGVIDQAPSLDTLRWFQDIEMVFQKYQIGCAVWTYKEKDFGLIGDNYAEIKEELISLWTKNQMD
ncbi:glycoside hydrolase family 5 protein [Anaeromicropila populeti]|uniref:Aryl-phospho-beta-D-glucosidase BglC, GH1 family n=1 Tax=Anaeromicropila populeti TaxID=37658 RepID=A0A1I6JR73_9FIRM|nr:cellulase family glycosylhydrolase [Anaeromicropila populeti]SFR81418.1 Aryl-phospho-beta-D-glucosidase BglC, GH1 family [Anaeromicropila populeti]